MRCNNCDDLLNLSLILKIPILLEVFLPSRTYMVQQIRQCVLTQGVIQENNLGVGRGESSNPNPKELNQAQLGGLEVLQAAPAEDVLGRSLLTKTLWLSNVLQTGLKSIHIWWYSSSFFPLFSLCSFFRALKNLLSSRTRNRKYNPMQI